MIWKTWRQMPWSRYEEIAWHERRRPVRRIEKSVKSLGFLADIVMWAVTKSSSCLLPFHIIKSESKRGWKMKQWIYKVFTLTVVGMVVIWSFRRMITISLRLLLGLACRLDGSRVLKMVKAVKRRWSNRKETWNWIGIPLCFALWSNWDDNLVFCISFLTGFQTVWWCSVVSHHSLADRFEGGHECH